MVTLYETIVRVHCDPESGPSRDEVLAGLRTELAAGHFLLRAEEDRTELTVTAQLMADSAALAQRQAEHIVSGALNRSGLNADVGIADTRN
jgi:hypothetical protein